jgi:hypothetical protein
MRHIDCYRYVFVGIMVLVGLWTVAQVFFMIVCAPVGAIRDPRVSAHCLGVDVLYENSVGNIVTDLIVLVLPMPMLYRLNTGKNEKWARFVLFGLGFL